MVYLSKSIIIPLVDLQFNMTKRHIIIYFVTKINIFFIKSTKNFWNKKIVVNLRSHF